MKHISEKVTDAVARIEKAVKEHNPIAVFGLFSGGHDSFSACGCLSLSNVANKRFLHIDTGIGVKRTRQYVEDTCRERGWELIVKEAAKNCQASGKPDPMVYEDIALKHGFPGPGSHGYMYIKLKERALCMVEREFGADCRGKNKKRILFISGARSQESERRMANTEEINVEGRKIWCAPIHDWTKLDTTFFLEHVNQARNPVVDLIHKSGECLCGAFAKPGELEELAMWPDTKEAYDRIKAIEKRVMEKHKWSWGQRPPGRRKCKLQPGQLCWSCMK